MAQIGTFTRAALMECLNPQPRSGRQEYLESLVNRFV
jgi:xylose isomerase